MRTRRNLSKTGIVCLLLLLALGTMDISYAQWSETLQVTGTVQTGVFSYGFTAASTNDPPGTIDPGKDKDVGSATAQLPPPKKNGHERVIVTITNAYPSYECQAYVTLQNHGTVPSRIKKVTITSPPEVTVTHANLLGVVLDPGQSVDGTVSVRVEQSAAQGATYTFTFTVEMYGILWIPPGILPGGTPGFWKNWDKHDTYTEEQIEGWLSSIDGASAWLVPDTDRNGIIDIGDMQAILTPGRRATRRATMEERRFLRHYLTTRLNVAAGRLFLGTTHDVTGISGYGYLGLASPRSATLTDIIAAIEGKHGTSVTRAQFEIMKDICDALNNLDI